MVNTNKIKFDTFSTVTDNLEDNLGKLEKKAKDRRTVCCCVEKGMYFVYLVSFANLKVYEDMTYICVYLFFETSKIQESKKQLPKERKHSCPEVTARRKREKRIFLPLLNEHSRGGQSNSQYCKGDFNIYYFCVVYGLRQSNEQEHFSGPYYLCYLPFIRG